MKLHFYILIRSWNALPYLNRCLESVLGQEFDNYTVLFVDDCSDYTKLEKNWIKERLRNHICIFNKERKFSVRNAFEMIHDHATKKNSVIVSVDGDDWLSSQGVLRTLEGVYNKSDCQLTYGDCTYFAPGQKLHSVLASKVSPFINHRFSSEVESKKLYRKEVFNPLHLRTWKTEEFKKIGEAHFLRSNGDWMKCCEDQAIFYPLLEAAAGNYQVISESLYIYNLENPRSDEKINSADRLLDEILLRKKSPNAK